MVAVVTETISEVLLTPKPVEAGKEYEVDIMEISRQGDGIARVQGFVVFVKNGKVGNKVKVKVTEVAERFSKAIIVGQRAYQTFAGNKNTNHFNLIKASTIAIRVTNLKEPTIQIFQL